jgi:hypothetical protein
MAKREKTQVEIGLRSVMRASFARQVKIIALTWLTVLKNTDKAAVTNTSRSMPRESP